MSKRTLFVLLAAICLLAAGGVAQADTPAAECTVNPVTTHPAADSPAVQSPDDEGAASLEDLLAQLTPDPDTKAIDGGICCTSNSQCPDVSGYGHFCSGHGCWQTGGATCLYYRK